jgi:hypothetical protein
MSFADLGSAQTLDDLRQSVRDVTRRMHYATYATALSDMAADGELSGGHLRIDGRPDTELSLMALPWRRKVDPERGLQPHAEVTVGYSNARLRFDDVWDGAAAGLETEVHTHYEAFAGDVGLGVSAPLGRGILVEPLAHVGVSYVRNQAYFGGVGSAFTDQLTRGILFNWDGWFGAVGGSLALKRPGLKIGDAEVSAQLRYDLRYSEAIAVDESALDVGDTLDWALARVDASMPASWHIAGQSVTWLGDIGYRRLLGGAADALGFDDFFELSVGLRVGTGDLVPGVSALQLSGAVMIGEDVTGWSFGLSARF